MLGTFVIKLGLALIEIRIVGMLQTIGVKITSKNYLNIVAVTVVVVKIGVCIFSSVHAYGLQFVVSVCINFTKSTLVNNTLINGRG